MQNLVSFFGLGFEVRYDELPVSIAQLSQLLIKVVLHEPVLGFEHFTFLATSAERVQRE